MRCPTALGVAIALVMALFACASSSQATSSLTIRGRVVTYKDVELGGRFFYYSLLPDSQDHGEGDSIALLPDGSFEIVVGGLNKYPYRFSPVGFYELSSLSPSIGELLIRLSDGPVVDLGNIYMFHGIKVLSKKLVKIETIADLDLAWECDVPDIATYSIDLIGVGPAEGRALSVKRLVENHVTLNEVSEYLHTPGQYNLPQFDLRITGVIRPGIYLVELSGYLLVDGKEIRAVNGPFIGVQVQHALPSAKVRAT